MGSLSSVIGSSISGRSGRYTQVLFQGIYSSTFDVVWISSFSKYSPKNWLDVRDTIDDYIITSGNHYSKDWVIGERSRLNNAVNIRILSLQPDLSAAMVWPPHPKICPPSPRHWSEIVDFHLGTATWCALPTSPCYHHWPILQSHRAVAISCLCQVGTPSSRLSLSDHLRGELSFGICAKSAHNPHRAVGVDDSCRGKSSFLVDMYMQQLYVANWGINDFRTCKRGNPFSHWAWAGLKK